MTIGLGSRITKPAIDSGSRIWVGTDFGGLVVGLAPGGGGIHQVFNFYPDRILAIDIDATGCLLVHKRNGLETRIERIDPLTGETLTEMEFGSVATDDPAQWYRAFVVDRATDSDGDGNDNGLEIAAGTNPWDEQSNRLHHVRVEGSQRSGAIVIVDSHASSETTALIAFDRSSSDIAVPGIGGALRLDPNTILPLSVPMAVLRSGLRMPGDPGLVGLAFYVQGIYALPGRAPEFTNAVDLRIFD